MRHPMLRSLLVLYITLLVSPIGTRAWLWKKPQTVVEEGSQDSEFIGWEGESYQADDSTADSFNNNAAAGYWIETLSWSPRAFLLHNFLSKEEALHLVSLGKDKLERSAVVDSDTGAVVPSDVRTSSGVFLKRQQDAVVSAVEERLAEVTHLPLENGEPLHILRYQDGEEYRPHFDYFHDNVHVQNGGQRVATVLLYLTDVQEGGETVFPDSEYKHPEGELHQWSTCAQAGLAVKPRVGDALLFYSLTPDGGKDKLSLHAGCPVIKGEKWSATKWIRLDKHATA